MIAIYQLFKIILGIFISVFILNFLIMFSASYASIEETSFAGATTKNMRTVSEQVYLSGNSIEFPGFAKKNFNIYFDTLSDTPGIVFGAGKIQLAVPTLFTPGRDLIISRGTLKHGWWKFYFVEAMPETLIILNPIANSDSIKSYISKIVNLFPDTTFNKVNITFAYCSGSFGDNPNEKPKLKFDFLSSLNNVPHSPCTSHLASNQRLLIIANSCASINSGAGVIKRGVCMEAPNADEMGMVYVIGALDGGVNKGRFYKDPADVVAMLIGWDDKPVGNNVSGEVIYDYKNDMYFQELKLAGMVIEKKSELVGQRLSDMISGGEIPYPGSDVQMCRDKHNEMVTTIQGLQAVLNNQIIKDRDYTSPGYPVLMVQLKTEIDNVNSKQNELINFGCDYRM